MPHRHGTRTAAAIAAHRLALAMLVAALGWSSPASAGHPATSPVDADSLRRRALVHLAQGTVESRRLALEDLDEATRSAPERVESWSELARLCAAMGQLARARHCLERATALAPLDPATQLALGLSWKWDWLCSTDDSSLARAGRCLLRAARLAPKDPEPRLALAALALAKGKAELAMLAAWSGLMGRGHVPTM